MGVKFLPLNGTSTGGAMIISYNL